MSPVQPESVPELANPAIGRMCRSRRRVTWWNAGVRPLHIQPPLCAAL